MPKVYSLLNPTKTTSINDIPDEILKHISGFCDSITLARLQRTNNRFKTIISSVDQTGTSLIDRAKNEDKTFIETCINLKKLINATLIKTDRENNSFCLKKDFNLFLDFIKLNPNTGKDYIQLLVKTWNNKLIKILEQKDPDSLKKLNLNPNDSSFTTAIKLYSLCNPNPEASCSNNNYSVQYCHARLIATLVAEGLADPNVTILKNFWFKLKILFEMILLEYGNPNNDEYLRRDNATLALKNSSFALIENTYSNNPQRLQNITNFTTRFIAHNLNSFSACIIYLAIYCKDHFRYNNPLIPLSNKVLETYKIEYNNDDTCQRFIAQLYPSNPDFTTVLSQHLLDNFALVRFIAKLPTTPTAFLFFITAKHYLIISTILTILAALISFL